MTQPTSWQYPSFLFTTLRLNFHSLLTTQRLKEVYPSQDVSQLESNHLFKIQNSTLFRRRILPDVRAQTMSNNDASLKALQRYSPQAVNLLEKSPASSPNPLSSSPASAQQTICPTYPLRMASPSSSSQSYTGNRFRLRRNSASFKSKPTLLQMTHLSTPSEVEIPAITPAKACQSIYHDSEAVCYVHATSFAS